MERSSRRHIHSFVVNFFLANKFHYSNGYAFPSLDKVVLNTFVQDLDSPVSFYYFRSLALVENLSSRKSIIKSLKKTLKGKKSYQVAVSHNITLRKGFLHIFMYFFILFCTKGMEDKFIRYNQFFSFDGHYYVRVRDVTALPGLAEEFFRWSYLLDCFFVTKLTNNSLVSKYFLKYSGFFLLEKSV